MDSRELENSFHSVELSIAIKVGQYERPLTYHAY